VDRNGEVGHGELAKDEAIVGRDGLQIVHD